MATIENPSSNPIPITRAKVYFYVFPCSGGLESITLTGDDPGNWAFSILSLGRAARVGINYTGTIAGGPEYHTVDVSAAFDDGDTLTQTLNFHVQPDATIIPNITGPGSINVTTGQAVNYLVTIDPVAGGTTSANGLPGWLSVSGGRITGTAPAVGSRTSVKLTVTVDLITHLRWFVIVVGDGGDGGGSDFTPGLPPGPRIYLDGDYSIAQVSGPPEFEIPFATDPKPYVYKLSYWQFFDDFSEPALGDPGPIGGGYAGGSAGSIKQIGAGIVEFSRTYARVPDSRSEWESFVYSYQIILVGGGGGITELPLTVQSRIQFDYFQTDNPSSIDIPRAGKAVQVSNTIYMLNDFCNTVLHAPTGQEILALDATYKIWKPGIYERQMRFIPWISIDEIFANSGCGE